MSSSLSIRSRLAAVQPASSQKLITDPAEVMMGGVLCEGDDECCMRVLMEECCVRLLMGGVLCEGDDGRSVV